MQLMFGDQNTEVLITVLVPNNCQAVGGDVRPCSDKDDGRSIDNLRELIIPRQNTLAELCLFGLLSDSFIFALTCISNVLIYEEGTNLELYLERTPKHLDAWAFRMISLNSLPILKACISENNLDSGDVDNQDSNIGSIVDVKVSQISLMSNG